MSEAEQKFLNDLRETVVSLYKFDLEEDFEDSDSEEEYQFDWLASFEINLQLDTNFVDLAREWLIETRKQR